MDVNSTCAELIEAYGIKGAPNEAQWREVLSLPDDQPISLVNFFKLRQWADYADGRRVTGQAAFDAYAAVSGPSLERAGGQFVFMAPFYKSFIGPDQDWDLVVVGRYPNMSSLLALFADPLYKEAYKDRTAACADQHVNICLG